MPASVFPEKPRGLALMLRSGRVVFTLCASILIALPLGLGWKSGFGSLLARTIALGLIAMLVFGLFEQWPRRLPNWLGRWVLQVFGVAMAMPVATFIIYVLSTNAGAQPAWQDSDRLAGFTDLCYLFILLASWISLKSFVA